MSEDKRLHHLLERELDGDLSPTEALELDRLARADVGARRERDGWARLGAALAADAEAAPRIDGARLARRVLQAQPKAGRAPPQDLGPRLGALFVGAGCALFLAVEGHRSGGLEFALRPSPAEVAGRPEPGGANAVRETVLRVGPSALAAAPTHPSEPRTLSIEVGSDATRPSQASEARTDPGASGARSVAERHGVGSAEFTSAGSPGASGARSVAERHGVGSAEFTSAGSPVASGARSVAERHGVGSAEFTSAGSPGASGARSVAERHGVGSAEFTSAGSPVASGARSVAERHGVGSAEFTSAGSPGTGGARSVAERHGVGSADGAREPPVVVRFEAEGRDEPRDGPPIEIRF